MRLHMHGRNTTIPPHMLGWIAEQLEKLNASYDDIYEARVTLVKRTMQAESRDLAHVQLMLAGKTLRMTQDGATLHEAVEAAIQTIASVLQDVRALRRGFRKPPTHREDVVPAYHHDTTGSQKVLSQTRNASTPLAVELDVAPIGE